MMITSIETYSEWRDSVAKRRHYDPLFELISQVLPERWQEVKFFAQVSRDSYEILFYVKVNGKFVSCFNLDKYGVSEKELREVFQAIYTWLLPEQVRDGWYAMTLLVASNGHFTVEYDYEDHSRDSIEYIENWKKKNFII